MKRLPTRAIDTDSAAAGDVLTYDAALDRVVYRAPASGGSTGGTATSDPRTLFRDDCAAGLPSGVTTSGGVGYDATEIHRTLTGAATYTSPSFALRGSVVAVMDMQVLSALNGADFNLKIMKGSSAVCRIAVQGDGNVVAYDSASNARGNTVSTTATMPIGLLLRLMLSVSPAGKCAATVSNIGGGSTAPNGNSQQTYGVHTLGWSSGLTGLAGGDALNVVLDQAAGTAARTTAVARIAVTNGSTPM